MIIDLTQELFSGRVFPGDTPPSLTVKQSDRCRLSDFTCCAHNGTHIDAPLHFINGGADIASLDLNRFIGKCAVVSDATAASKALLSTPRVLIRGCINLSDAKMLSDATLIGTDAQSIAEEDSTDVHRLLLGRGIPLLEGLDLSNAPDGVYTLIALPLKLGGADGAPVRAVLID